MSITFTGPLLVRVSDVLEAAFPTRGPFERMLLNSLGTDFNAVDITTGFPSIVLAHCQKAKSEGELEKLIRLAHVENPANPDLRSLHQELFNGVHPIPGGGIDPYQRCWLGSKRIFLNREGLRKELKDMNDFEINRLMIVRGDARSGKSYTSELVRYLARTNDHSTLSLDLRNYPPNRKAVPMIAREIACSNDTAAIEIHAPELGLESSARWIYQPLITWTLSWLKNATRPGWIIVDGFDHEIIHRDVYDFLTYLGERIEHDFPKVRLILIGYDQPEPAEWKTRFRSNQTTFVTEEHLKNFLSSLYLEHNLDPNDAAIPTIAKDLSDKYGQERQRYAGMSEDERADADDPLTKLNSDLVTLLTAIQ